MPPLFLIQGEIGGIYNYSFATAVFTLTFRRKPYYYVLTIIVPTMVLAMLSAFTFLVPIDSGEKLSLGISILLAFSVLVLIVSEVTPQTSEGAPVIGMGINTLRPRQNGHHFADEVFKRVFLNENL